MPSSSESAKAAIQRFASPSILQRAYLRGILHKPQDVLFMIRLLGYAVWGLVRFHCLELPFLLLTGFKYETVHYAKGWNWFLIIGMGLIRTVGPNLRTIGHLRFAGLFIERSLPLQAMFIRKVQVQKNVQIQVQLEALLRPERACVAQIRRDLAEGGFSSDPMEPSLEYLQSMHPRADPRTGITPLANIPEETGRLNKDDTFTLKGEWIESLVDPKDTRPRSNTVILYLHGGGHAFLSPASHRDLCSRLARDVGPGTRVFSVDYRMAPEHPFPAAIHDAFAAFLYLTEPGHEALVFNNHNDKKSARHHVPVDPRDVVVGGDSAGGNLAVVFMLYLAKYVQPATTPKYIIPHCALLLSAWADPTSSMPSAHNNDWYCYCPGPIGTSPYDRNAFMNMKTLNLARNYLIGDFQTVPNPRNALGKELQWQWYRHLAQHPLVSPVHRAEVSGLTNTLLQTATHDRLVDEDRLYAHRLGLANQDKLTRIEVYRDMMHVHQVFPMLKSARIATRNLARFIHRSEQIRDQEPTGEFVRIEKDKETVAPADGVEWVMIEQNGKEIPGDEGWPLNILSKVWPPNEHLDSQSPKEA
ncbi:hypothetical protein BGZ83_011190 [Gryganskiella cystojenkinii]|nr:hypothetical protein BGZ83_011190 [Gryganskiella cystojenkinii]